MKTVLATIAAVALLAGMVSTVPARSCRVNPY